jgi:hypothetical protein
MLKTDSFLLFFNRFIIGTNEQNCATTMAKRTNLTEPNSNNKRREEEKQKD